MNLDPVRAEKTLTIWQDFNGTRLKGSCGTSETTPSQNNEACFNQGVTSQLGSKNC